MLAEINEKEMKETIVKINKMPVQVRCTILDAWGWCNGTTQRDGMEREDRGGFRMGNTCIPVAKQGGPVCTGWW